MRFIFIATGLSNRCWLPCSPRGYHVSTVFRREQSNSPDGTLTRVEASFAGCWAVTMQSKNPLILTLSPSDVSDGAREKTDRRGHQNGDDSRKRRKDFPRPIGWGEGQGEGRVQLNTHG